MTGHRWETQEIDGEHIRRESKRTVISDVTEEKCFGEELLSEIGQYRYR